MPARVLSGRSGSRSGEERGEYAAQARFHLDDGVAEPGVGGVELAEAGARGGHLPQGAGHAGGGGYQVEGLLFVEAQEAVQLGADEGDLAVSGSLVLPLVFAAGMVALCFWVLWMRRRSLERLHWMRQALQQK